MKLIRRSHYLNRLAGIINTPEIKILTGIRRSGKSKLLNAFADYIRQSDDKANIIEIDLPVASTSSATRWPIKEYA